MLRIVLAVLHLLALGIGLGAIYSRARALRRIGASAEALQRAFAADVQTLLIIAMVVAAVLMARGYGAGS
jgi:hypothetical protein